MEKNISWRFLPTKMEVEPTTIEMWSACVEVMWSMEVIKVVTVTRGPTPKRTLPTSGKSSILTVHILQNVQVA